MRDGDSPVRVFTAERAPHVVAQVRRQVEHRDAVGSSNLDDTARSDGRRELPELLHALSLWGASLDGRRQATAAHI
jgi:hypothetical protein